MHKTSEENLKKVPVLHPLFFALSPVLSLYLRNIRETSLLQTLKPAVFVLGITLGLFLLLSLIIRNSRKAGIIISISLLLCFSFREAVLWSTGVVHTSLYRAAAVLLVAWSVVFLAGTYLVMRSRRRLDGLTKILNVASAATLLILLIRIGAYEIRTGAGAVEIIRSRIVEMDATAATGPAKPGRAAALPDIYYIVLDRYPSASSLKEFYDFDNGDFIKYLRDKGFYVASESSANYPTTAHSLASSLNMDYIRVSPREVKKVRDSWLPLYRAMEDHNAARLLKSMGYRYVHFGSWFEPTRNNEHADLNINYMWSSEFSWALYRSTALYPVLAQLFNLDARTEQRYRVLYKFQKLREVPEMKGPVFVFAHFLIPHDPYVFDRKGNVVTRIQEMRSSAKANFVNQLSFTNTKVKELVDRLISSSRRPPVIIIQSDEGPYPVLAGRNVRGFRAALATDAELRQKMQILNAYYLPGVDKGYLHPSITPVNSFRLVSNLYFGTNYELLPNRNFTFVDHLHLYDFVDVTDRLKQ